MQIQSIPMVYVFFNGQVVDGFQGNIPESQVIEFIQKVSDLSGPSPEIKENLHYHLHLNCQLYLSHQQKK